MVSIISPQPSTDTAPVYCFDTAEYHVGVNSNARKQSVCAVCVALVAISAAASQPEDSAADAVAAAFLQARNAAHLSTLGRIHGNPFHKQVCKQDWRFPSGLINNVRYQTTDPSSLPEAAQRLAASPDGYKVTNRFGVGVCALAPDSSGQATWSVVIATYESGWTSFWRIFWD